MLSDLVDNTILKNKSVKKIKMNTKNKIQQIRGELRVIDDKIIKLLERRVKKSIKVQKVKYQAGLTVIDEKQEQNIFDYVTSKSSLSSKELELVFKSILYLSKKEFQLQQKQGRNSKK